MTNNINIKPLIKFLLWSLTGIVICLVGITNVKADTYRPDDIPSIQFYDNLNSGLSAITTNITTGGWSTIIPTMVSYGKGAAIGVSSPIALLANHTYTVSITIDGNYGGNIVLSSLNNVGVGTSLSNAVSSYNNNSNVVENYSKVLNDGMTIQFAFTPSINASYFIIPFSISSGGSNYTFTVSSLSIDDLGSSGVTQDEINNSLTNQTNELNQSIQNSTNDINQNINDMEQSIIDSNKETQDVIKDQFNDCFTQDITFTDDDVNISGVYLSVENSLISLSGWGVIEFVKIYPNQNYVLTMNNVWGNNPAFCIYDSNKELISCTKYEGNTSFEFNSSNAEYISLSTSTNVNGNLKLISSEICTNKIDETNDKLDNLQGSITDDTPPDVSSFGDVAGWLPPGPLDSILNLPLTLLNNLNTNLGKSCSPLTVNIPYVNKTIQIPCISTIFNQITGVTSFWNWVGTIAAAFILFNYLIALYNWVDRVLSLRLETYEAFGGVSKDFGSV